MATVKQLTVSGYQVTITRTELALIRNALDEAQRVMRFAIEVLDDVDNSRGAEHSGTSRLRREIEALAMREASLRSLRETVAKVDQVGTPTHSQHADLD